VSSERPKLALETPKVITAWLSTTGRVVYLTRDRGWSQELGEAEVLTGAGANDVLAWAAKDQRRVADPYFMQVSADGKVAGRETIRETIRASGPTTHRNFGKQAGNN
jgi:Protein of unknown function (DUF2849)